ncbi:hypothetical protein H257_13890 [Aphanomyces astaci]|uniref:Integrase catalytic domain-containing protein n=1 Tax=Aphanomyces astaci TaxID=112090 RepID=W4FTH4_APHAT|nr:hypothetical protein H257_13890 [Aphanomyces astaci]ETV70815.1 hypothetical protein H257_13890 [Aphanomyces astaci]|eukprot:XP_009839879.1 hypothetical protein H257_13890 [Aphanomyces astaci]
MPNKSAESVVQPLWNHVVCVFGPCRELMSDRASFGVSPNVKQLHPVAYRPALMGLVERFNKAVKDMLSTMVQDIEVDATADGDPLPETEEVVELRPVVGTGLEPMETTRLRRSTRQLAAANRQMEAENSEHQADEIGIRQRK